MKQEENLENLIFGNGWSMTFILNTTRINNIYLFVQVLNKKKCIDKNTQDK